jgi:competence protein ComEA
LEDNMNLRRTKLAWVILICLSLALAPLSALGQQSKASQKAASTEKVNLNTATAEQLQTLPGVGPAIAKRILDHRAKNGKFNKVEEILNVKGIGEKKFQRMKDRLVV